MGHYSSISLMAKVNPIWTGVPPEGFAKYLKNGLANLYETL